MDPRPSSPHLDEGVLWLDVPVEEPMLVHIRDPLEHLEHYASNFRLREWLCFLPAIFRRYKG